MVLAESPHNPLAGRYAPPPGSLENVGLLISAPECRALSSLELDPASWAHVPARTLLLAVPGDRAADTLAAGLAAAGSDVTDKRDPKVSTTWWLGKTPYLPKSTSRTVIEWLTHDLQTGSRGRTIVSPTATRLLDGREVREEAFTIPTHRGECMAITATPANAAEKGWIVFLNSSLERRGLLHRLSTTWSRHWARAGVPSLRLDTIGIGDSGGYEWRDEHYESGVECFYGPDVIRNLRAYLDWLADNRGATRFAVIGLCSGAANACELALADSRVDAVAMLNPPFLRVDSGVLSLLARQDMHGVVKGPRGLAAYLLARARDPADVARAARGWARYRRGVRKASIHGEKAHDALASLTGRGCRVLMISDDEDEGIGYLEGNLGADYRRQLEELGVRLEILDDLDHTFQPIWCHDLLRELVERLLAEAGFLAEGTARPGSAHELGTAR
jgi:dienelactone hydrolase